jgi:hypothetical protein
MCSQRYVSNRTIGSSHTRVLWFGLIGLIGLIGLCWQWCRLRWALATVTLLAGGFL